MLRQLGLEPPPAIMRLAARRSARRYRRQRVCHQVRQRLHLTGSGLAAEGLTGAGTLWLLASAGLTSASPGQPRSSLAILPHRELKACSTAHVRPPVARLGSPGTTLDSAVAVALAFTRIDSPNGLTPTEGLPAQTLTAGDRSAHGRLSDETELGANEGTSAIRKYGDHRAVTSPGSVQALDQRIGFEQFPALEPSGWLLLPGSWAMAYGTGRDVHRRGLQRSRRVRGDRDFRRHAGASHVVPVLDIMEGVPINARVFDWIDSVNDSSRSAIYSPHRAAVAENPGPG